MRLSKFEVIYNLFLMGGVVGLLFFLFNPLIFLYFSVIVDKDRKPRWKPATLEEVSDERVEYYFSPLEEELNLSSDQLAVFPSLSDF